MYQRLEITDLNTPLDAHTLVLVLWKTKLHPAAVSVSVRYFLSGLNMLEKSREELAEVLCIILNTVCTALNAIHTH